MNKEQLLKILKNKNNRIICLIFIIGVVLIAVSHYGGGNKSAPKAYETAAASEEERLAAILSEIDGAGKVSVMITYYSGAEKTLAYETKTSSRDTGGEMSEDKKAVMTNGEPMVVKEVYPRVKGVIIAAGGAEDTSVRAAISQAVSATLDVPAHRICIFKKEED